MGLVDGYFHIGLPRFQSVETAVSVMDAKGIGAGLVCPFETGPDIHEVHRAYRLHPDRFRVFGLALGKDRAEVERGMHAQLDAGFLGFRLANYRLRDDGYLLDVIGARGGVPLVVGEKGLADVAAMLLSFLERYPDLPVVSPHMAGPTNVSIFDDNAEVRALFSHPRFFVVMSRQTLFEPGTMKAWGEVLIEGVGWDRLMWGSEAPVLYWRDETIEQAAKWIDQFAPSPSELDAFRSGNARRVIFQREVAPPSELRLPYDPMDHELKRPAPMWPHGFSADTRLPEPLVRAWLDAGGPDKESLSAFANRLMLAALSKDTSE